MIINASVIFSALSNIAGLLAGGNSDVVGIFDANLNQVFINARPLRADVRETSRVMTHPVETGVMIADNHIINPVEINLSLSIKSEYYNSMYNQIKQAFILGTVFSVQTRTGVYNNMIISDMPHTEEPDKYDAILMGLHFTQVLYVTPVALSSESAPANFSPADPVNDNTVQGGVKYPTSLSTTQTTAVRSIFTGVGFKALGRL
jgi:hypothetical protein